MVTSTCLFCIQKMLHYDTNLIIYYSLYHDAHIVQDAVHHRPNTIYNTSGTTIEYNTNDKLIANYENRYPIIQLDTQLYNWTPNYTN